jgi:tetratricopeptide (TPR) repeat protein
VQTLRLIAQTLIACASITTGCSQRGTTPKVASPSPIVEPHRDASVDAEAKIKRLLEKGDVASALSFAQQFHLSMRERFGPDHAETAKALMLLGIVQTYNGSRSEALLSLEQALTTQERLLGGRHRDVGYTLRYISAASYQSGQVAEAAQAAARATSILEEALGANHPDVANTLSTLGLARHALKDWRSASVAFTRALEIRVRALGPADVLVGPAKP